MTSALLALALMATPPLWVTTQGFDPEACSSDAFAAAVRSHRPGVDVHAWHPELNTDWPPPGALRVRLSMGDGVTLLDVIGGSQPLQRYLPASEGCERNVEVAALIVDGALDSLDLAEAAPQVDSLAPPVPLARQLHLGATVGAGVEQGPLGLVPALDVEGSLRFRFYELTLDADVGLPASRQFQLQLPESGGGAISVTVIAAVLGLGVAPRLGPGPGHLLADALLGVSLPVANTTGTVFQQATQVAPLFFSGLRVGYLADLPANLFVGARVEERVGLTSAFVVNNGSDNPVVTTRTWTFEALGLLGYHFF